MAIVKQSGRYFVRLYLAPGKRKWYKGGFDTREEAEAFEESLKRGAKAETLDEFSDRWLRDYPPAKDSTLNTYRQALARFREDFKGTPVAGPLERSPWAREQQLRGTDYQVARAWALRNEHRRRVVRNMMNAAKAEGLVLTNPFADLRIKESKGRKDIVPLTQEEVESLARCASVLRPENEPVVRGAILTLAYTGIRISELFALRWSDVDLKAQEAQISRRAYRGSMDTPKSGKPRPILLPDQAVEGISLVPRRLGQELVFPSPRGRVFTSVTFGRYWDQVRSAFQATLPHQRLEDLARYRPDAHTGLTVHELRHFCASWMLDQGASVEMVAQQLGHSSEKITNDYGHPNEKAMRERLRSVLAPRPITSLTEVKERKASNG